MSYNRLLDIHAASNFTRMPRGHAQHPDRAEKPKPWNLWTVRVAILVSVLSGGAWVFAAATAPARADGSSSGGPVPAASLGEISDSSAPHEGEDPPQRLIDKAAPRFVALGLSFLGGFFLAWSLKKFIKIALIVVSLLVATIITLRLTGAIDLPWERLEDDVRGGASWLQSQAGTVAGLLKGYLPSTAAAVFGGIVGVLRG